MQAVGRSCEVLDVVTVVGFAAESGGAQPGRDLGLRGARGGAIALPQGGAVFVVLDERADPGDVVLVQGNLVADVEDREIDRRGVRVLATAAARALGTGGEQRSEAEQQSAGPGACRDAVRVFA